MHEKLKPHSQITTNNKHFTVENVHPPFPSTICTYGGSEELQNLKLFKLKLAIILHLSYSLDILILNNTGFWFTNGELQLNDGFPIIKYRTNAAVYALRNFTLIETLLPIIECDVSGKYSKRRGQRTPDFLNLYFEFRDKKYTVW